MVVLGSWSRDTLTIFHSLKIGQHIHEYTKMRKVVIDQAHLGKMVWHTLLD